MLMVVMFLSHGGIFGEGEETPPGRDLRGLSNAPDPQIPPP